MGSSFHLWMLLLAASCLEPHLLTPDPS